MKKILIIGSNGQLGSDLFTHLKRQGHNELFKLDHSRIELKDKNSVFEAITGRGPDVVINCAAYVRVDDCEDNPEEALHVNSLGAGFVAQACAVVNADCVYISTDYVFDGEKKTPYTENDPAYPINIYGISKLSGEHFVRSSCPNHYIIRSSGLYGLSGSRGKGGNFVETILKNAEQGIPLKVVDDQILAPTFTMDLSATISSILDGSPYGTYHATNQGQCSWYSFTKKILDITGLKTDIKPTTTEMYGAKARRPRYSVLSNRKLEESGINAPRPWEQALENYISLRN